MSKAKKQLVFRIPSKDGDSFLSLVQATEQLIPQHIGLLRSEDPQVQARARQVLREIAEAVVEKQMRALGQKRAVTDEQILAASAGSKTQVDAAGKLGIDVKQYRARLKKLKGVS